MVSAVCMEICTGTWSTSFLPSTLTWVLSGLLLSPSPQSSLPCNALPFLKSLSQRHYHLVPGFHPCLAVGWLEPAGAYCVHHWAALAAPHRGRPVLLAVSAWAWTPSIAGQEPLCCAGNWLFSFHSHKILNLDTIFRNSIEFTFA